MKVAIIFLATLAYASASGYFQPGFSHVGNGVAAPYRNADRQRAVNNVAEHVGAGTGTARFYGVPGAYGNNGRRGYGGSNSHNAGYGGAIGGFGSHGSYGGRGFGSYGQFNNRGHRHH